MKYLCLAYGAEKDWVVLSKDEQNELLAADEVLRTRGDMVAILGEVTTVTTWDTNSPTSPKPYATSDVPIVGFSIIEASDIDEAIRLVQNTPCARAGGAIEIRPITKT